MVANLEGLLGRIQQEAQREEFPVDLAVYSSAGKDPSRPILFAGALDAEVCFLGRDLGKDEVRVGEPLVGAGGSLIRRGILKAWGQDELARGSKTQLEAALRHTLLTNTVPYKPPGNKAYSESVKQRFRPFVVEFLTGFWTGKHVIPLGTEAFLWFGPYSDQIELKGRTDARFEETFRCELPVLKNGVDQGRTKTCLILPLPHPSPLNRRWLPLIPEMLASRLSEIRQTPT